MNPQNAALDHSQRERIQYETALHFMVEETVAKTGAEFYHTCVRSIADIFQAQYAFVTELVDDTCSRSRMLSLWTGESFVEPYEFDLSGTPCQVVFRETWGIFPRALQATFPEASALATLGAESYLAVVIPDSQGNPMGNLGFIDTKPLPDDLTIAKSILKLFAARVGAEMERHADKEKLQIQGEQHLLLSQTLQQTLQDLQRTQSQILQAEKMSSLGQLVAGIAHEINNPVNFIHGNLSAARAYFQDLLDLLESYQQAYPQPLASIVEKSQDMDLAFLRQDLPMLLDSMTSGTHRIREIVTSLRTFSRLDESELKSVDIHTGIESTLMLLQNRLRSKPGRHEIQVIKDYGTFPPIECFAGHLNQVFMNIFSNAIDALESLRTGDPHLPSGDLPTLMISTETQTDRLTIQVTDNGIGIPQDLQSQIFDPFFTTKPVGQGTGMGLSISYQVITQKHGGHLSCHSEPGKGSKFIIQIPLSMREG
jgi:two-component system, NtrC family, sensor kinase